MAFKQRRRRSGLLALGGGCLLLLVYAVHRAIWPAFSLLRHPSRNMPGKDNIYELPRDLPVPTDDGACNHLVDLQIPSIQLLSTSGRQVDLGSLPGRIVVYCYPRTGRPDQVLPKGWNAIPGARGCTPQSCAYRDHYQEFRSLGVQVFGLSTQDTDYQKEAAHRLRLPFDLLSDSSLVFVHGLRLPTFEVEGMTLVKRLTLVIDNGRITKVFYPVFPPDQNATEVIQWLSTNPVGK